MPKGTAGGVLRGPFGLEHYSHPKVVKAGKHFLAFLPEDRKKNPRLKQNLW